ncbi:MAG: isomerase [Gammaproteobacteria bacterium]|nr:isomerase [Gammaproteobacteria bacterium]
MKLPIYYVDAFTEKVFHGNPAAVVIVKKDLTATTMQSIAFENNLSETAFVNISLSPYSIRWFTPKIEVDLCGHATLASSRILFDEYLPNDCSHVIFDSNTRGRLKAFKKEDLIYLDFPADELKEAQQNNLIAEGLGEKPIHTYRGNDDYLAIFDDEEIIRGITPEFNILSQLDSRGLIITAPGVKVDFVSRFFAPQSGVDEDPVTGSAYTLMIPYWHSILGKKKFSAKQLSFRSGNVECELIKDRVLIGGKTVRYLEGEIVIK